MTVREKGSDLLFAYIYYGNKLASVGILGVKKCSFHIIIQLFLAQRGIFWS
jgi:hypothetical protein